MTTKDVFIENKLSQLVNRHGKSSPPDWAPYQSRSSVHRVSPHYKLHGIDAEFENIAALYRKLPPSSRQRFLVQTLNALKSRDLDSLQRLLKTAK